VAQDLSGMLQDKNYVHSMTNMLVLSMIVQKQGEVNIGALS
jgi:hypothetical protein